MLERYLRPFEAGRGLQAQLRENLLDALLDGALSPGEPMPSSRHLSQLLKVSRNTVVLVYEQLVQDGFLTSAKRRGYFINEKFVSQQLRVRFKPAAPALGERPDDAPNWGQRIKCHPSQFSAIVKPRNWRDYDYPFIYGQVEYDEVTTTRWRNCTRLASLRAHMRSWIDDHVTLDDPILVEQIMQRILPKRAITARPEEIMVTIGTQNSLYLVAQLLGGGGTVLGLENPGYVDARHIFELSGTQLRPLRVDAQGLVINEQLNPCDLVFCTPSHQSPTGVTLPIYRRMALLEKAREQDFLVIEDDYDTEHNALGGNHPALKSFDHSGRVIYLGSLTKNLLPGVRLGYIVADEELIHELRALRRYMYRHPPQNNQRTMALFLSMGYHDEHARRHQEMLGRKWRLVTQAMHQHLPEFEYSGMPGGSSIWVHGPLGFDAWDFQRRAAQRGALIEPGDIHFIGQEAPKDYFRLGFSAIADERINPGIAALAQAWRAMAPGRSLADAA
ncbi:MocR-like pyridoxine biosynthesis transcription factor PdxR [Roseateles koreensis]|uniref:PLP-dependent aminotransferase family protein n=1 Tax=Roseateles koreensis TaxID=2987526 RepID=A0ABT5KV12_9BURK|nr:PLP-dependent aminotransferase family protein [Roseateles koreensis]MDC8786749.1 PLP-dependent aminotransferase family protein [Roseateles koreensis]